MQQLKGPIRPMKLFTEWDVENAAPNCIPRLCCFRVVHLEVFQTLEVDLNALVLCVAMRGSRRSLRSDQIPVQTSGTADVDLDLVFTLQYPHFLKRRQNLLQIMLQRRKKYRNRPILGYKTLAVGYINMAQVLQGWYSPKLNLFAKDEKSPVAVLTIGSLTSEPIDRDIHERRNTIEHPNLSSDDDSYSSDVEDSAGEMEQLSGYTRQDLQRKVNSHNLKQRIIKVLFKKLKVTDEDFGHVQKELQRENLKLQGNDYLFDDDDDEDEDDDIDDDDIDDDDDEEEEDNADYMDDEDRQNYSAFLADTMSIGSVQRPGLRPFFDQNKSSASLNTSTLTKEETKQLHKEITQSFIENSGEDSKEPSPSSDSDQGQKKNSKSIKQMVALSGKSGKDKIRRLSLKDNQSGNKVSVKHKTSVDLENCVKEGLSVINDQVNAALGRDDNIPDYILLIGLNDDHGQRTATKMMSRIGSVIFTPSNVEVQFTIAAVVNKFQKFCNRHSVSPPSIKIGLLGPESFICLVVTNFVEQFSQKRQEYQNYIKFLIIPTASFKIATYISQIDSKYKMLFMDSFWKKVFEHDYFSESDFAEIERRIRHYLEHSDSIHSIPIAEALITYKTPSSESSQLFIPFISEVRIGTCDTESNIDESLSSGEKKDLTAPSPRQETTESSRISTLQYPINETLDLLVDYWPIQSFAANQLQGKKEERKEANKLSIKSAFRTLSVLRLSPGECDGLLFSANLKTRSKGVKRLMKPKDKDVEAKSTVSALVSKIVCTARSSGHTFNVLIDGHEWTDVKFFSLSSQWPTHIKNFPLGMFLNYQLHDTT
ncbi:phosphofurin acidic cluster sorting protein 1 isoform X6 [Hydra vulgaris]|uniref:Phosphofurin acidic cluster sorting protein 1 isoform X6 n=1 Tax=Hydra vulgaris TaxID=6087 RepID=A0ABM4CGK0_HYDVU